MCTTRCLQRSICPTHCGSQHKKTHCAMPDLSWLISTYFLPVRNVDSYAHVVTSDNKSTDIRTEQTRLSTDANFSRMNEIVNCSKLLMTEPDCELHQTSHDWTRLWTAPNFWWLNQIVNCKKLLMTEPHCELMLIFMTEPDCEPQQTFHDWTRLWTAANFSWLNQIVNCTKLLSHDRAQWYKWHTGHNVNLRRYTLFM